MDDAIGKFLITRDNALLMVIDIQEKLCKAMDPQVLEHRTANARILLDAARELGVPVLSTEQYPVGLGCTLPILKEKLPGPPIEKMSFSCCGDEAFRERLASHARSRVIITGMEAHICVLQTVLDLLEKGYYVHVVSDAVISRKMHNWQVGLDIASKAGAVITSTETILFQLLKTAGTEEFKKLSKLVR